MAKDAEIVYRSYPATGDKLAQLYPPDAQEVAPGQEVFIKTIDHGTLRFANPTDHILIIPTNENEAYVLSIGFSRAVTGGSGEDAQARAAIAVFYKKGGDVLKPGEEVFVLMADGIPANWKNPNPKGGKALKVPDAPTADNMLAAGFERLGGTVDGQDIIKAWKTERTAWTVDDMVDFTVAEPPLTNIGKRYLSTKTGKGSTSANLDFHDGDLYEVTPDGEWAEYEPKDSWTLTHEEHNWAYFNGKWNLVPGIAHSHDRIVAGDYIYYLSDKGNLVKYKKTAAQPNTVTPQARQMAALDGTQAADAPVAAALVAPEPGFTEEILRFSGGLGAWKPGEEIEEGYIRTFTFMGVETVMISQVDRKCRQTIDLDELLRDGKTADEQTKENWIIFAQPANGTWMPNQPVPFGFRITWQGFTGENSATRVSSPNFDIPEQLSWTYPSTAAIGSQYTFYWPDHNAEVEKWVCYDPTVPVPADGYPSLVYADATNPNRINTIGMVSLVIDSQTVLVRLNSAEPDPRLTTALGRDNPSGTVFYLGTNGDATTVRPTTYPIRVLGSVIDPPYININQYTIEEPFKIIPKDLLSGVGAPPDTLGTDGNYYLQLDAKLGDFEIWGPKTDKWPTAAQHHKTPDLSGKVTALETDNTTNKTDIAALKTKTTATDTALAALDANVKPRITALEAKKAESEVSFNRSPTNLDLYKAGMIWNDVSFGVDSPLQFVSLGGGAWQYLNAISLRAIRIYVQSTNASYPSCRNVRFLDKDGKTIPYNNWIVGARSAGFYAPAQGSIYTGAGAQEPPNKSTGWFELEPSSLLDLSRGLAGGWASLRPDTPVTGITKIELYFSSGAMKSYTCVGVYSGDKQFLTLPEWQPLQYGSSVASALGEMLTAAKLSNATNNDFGRVSGAVFDSAYNSKAAPLTDRVVKLEARKEVVDNKAVTVLLDGNTLIDPGQRPSGFSNDGTGDVTGATSWNSWQAVGIPVSGSGLATDVYEISAAFGAAASFGQVTVYIGSDSRRYTNTGLQAGTLEAREWFDGNWRGITVTVKGDFSGHVDLVGFNGAPAYVGPVVRRLRVEGLAVDNKRLALFSDLPKAVDLSGYESKAELDTKLADYLKKTDQANVDLTGYAKLSDVLSDVKATGYPKLDKLWLSYATQNWVNDQLGDMQAAVNRIGAEWPDIAKKTDIPSFKAAFDNAADYRVPDSGDTALTGSQYVFTIPARATKLLSIEFEYHRPNSTHVDYWDITTDFMKGISGGTIPNDTDGWHYRTNGYYHEIIKYFYGGWAFYFDFIFQGNGSLEIKVFTVGHYGEYKNILCRYDAAPLHKLTLADLNAATSTTPGVVDPKTVNDWLKAKNPSAADLSPVQAALKVLQDNEAADDTSFAALKAVVDAIPAAPDLSQFAKSVDVDKKADKAELPVIQRDNADHNPAKLSSIIGSVAYLENSNAGGFAVNAVDYPVGHWSILTNPTDDDGYLFVDGFSSVYTVLGKTDMPSDTSVAYKVKANKTFLLQIIDKAGKSIKLTEITDDFAKFALKSDIPSLNGYAKVTDIPDPPPGIFLGTMLHSNVPGSFPTTRQDGTPILAGDFVRTVAADGGAYVEDYINLGGPNWRTTGTYAPNLAAALATEVTARTSGDTALDGRVATIETKLSQVRSVYLGTFENQAGDTGHQFTQQRKTGTGITTSDNITFTLTGGIYRVEVGIVRHMAGNTWRYTTLQVNGTNVEGIYSGHDGSNWEGSSPLVRYVDASTSQQTVKIVRASSTGNGNACGFLDIRQEAGIVVPTGTVIVTPRVISGSITGQAYEELDWPVRIPLNSGESLTGVTVNGTAVAYDAQSGFFVIPKGKGAVTIAHTVTSGLGVDIKFASVNSGVDVTFGNYKIQLSFTGNRAMKISTVSGTATINGETSFYGPTGHGFAPVTNLSVTTTPGYLYSLWGFGNAYDTQKLYFKDNGGGIYEFQMRVGPGYNGNSFVMIKLK